MTRAPHPLRRINQFLACAVPRDAVSNFVFRCDDAFRGEDPRTRIWAESYDPVFEGRVSQFVHYPEVRRRSDNCIWHVSTDSFIAPWLAAHVDDLVVYFHNITPSDLVRPYDKVLADRLDLAREQTAALAPNCRLALANSTYSADELLAWGYPAPKVENRLLFDDSARLPEPDQRLFESLMASKQNGPGVVFVGRVTPNKGQDHLIRALSYLRRLHPDAQLWLVGGVHLEAYATVLEELADDLGVGGGIFAGSVTPSEMAAYLAAADIFCSMSEHEGFGVPILEAMRAGLPVVAYGESAVPETADGAALVLDSREPEVVSEAISMVFEDSDLRDRLIRAGAARIARLEPIETAEARLAELLRAGAGS